MRDALLGIVAMVLSVTGTGAQAQPAPEPPAAPQPQAVPPVEPQPSGRRASPGYHTHDGFFLQLNSGIGGLSSSASQGGDEAKLSGAMGSFSATIGGAVVPNLIVGGQIWDVVALAPDLEVSGQTRSGADATLALVGFGLNVTYYVMPVNIYLSATPSIGGLSVKSFGNTIDYDGGFALRLAAGKEWWVSGNWGIGVNVHYAYGSNKQQQGGPTWTTNAFGVAFTATYN